MECVSIKQEAVECDVVVKVETELEQHEWSSACGVKEEAGGQTECGVKEEAGGQTECGVSAAAARAGLYAGCEVKGELVLGATALQPPDGPSALPPPVSWEAAAWAGVDRLRARSVRLERLPPDAHANSAILSMNAKSPPANRLYSCGACGEQFARKWSFIRHIRFHSSSSNSQAPAGSVPNGVPDDSGSAPAALPTAARARAGDKPYQCPLCTKRYLNWSHLVVHERIHTGEKPYKCDICLKQFAQQSNLVRHVRSHTGEKPYKCDICQKQFTHKSHLNDHRKIHTGEKPFECDICLKQFTQKSHLVTHVRIHTLEKPYKCDICQKQFTQKINLVNHVRMHTGEKSYKCDICQKLFRLKSHLVVHVRIHTGGKPFECDICLKQFKHKRSLLYHVNKHTD